MRVFFGIVVLILTFASAAVGADDGFITLKDLELEALKNNPEILMFQKKVESADEKKTVAAAMPDPKIGYMVQNVGAPFTWSVGQVDMSLQGVIFSQEIPFPGKLGTKGRAAGRMADQQHDALLAARLRIVKNLRNAYYDYYLAFKSAEILDQTKELMKNIERIAETRYATGQGMQQDVIRAQLEITMLLDRLAEEELKKEKQASQINSLVGRNPLAPLGKPTALPNTVTVANLDQLAEMALSHSPVLETKKQKVEQNREELSLSRREYLPDMTLSGGWFKRGEKPDVWQASVMFRIPLYFWNKAAGVDAAKAEVSAARYEYDAERLATLARVRDLAAAIDTSQHHLHLYESGIIPQAKLALQSATTNYQVGKAGFPSLLESESMLLKYQLMEQAELVNLNKTKSQLGEITGEENE
jgi:cobalt-zinc-cadmium efflux system outer membrane protein